MKVAHVAVYLDFKQAHVMRLLAQNALRDADEDLELLQKLHSESARSWVQVTISGMRDTYQELADKAKEAREKFCDGEYDDDDAETLEIRLMVGDPVEKLVAIAKRRSAPMTSIAEIWDKINNVGRAVSSADAHACAQAVGAFYQSIVPDMVYLLDCVSALRDAIADAAADLTDIADSLATRYGTREMDRTIIRGSIAEAVDALIDAERESVEPAEEGKR